MQWVAQINDAINSFIWVKIGIWLLFGSGVLMTILTGFFQFGHVRHWLKNTVGSLFKKDVIGHTNEKGAISPFQALCTALAATIGTGNIAGVAAAIVIGGPGAIFWMWIAALFGMMTSFSENVLGLYFRRKNPDGQWAGGAMYYLKDGLGQKKGCKWLGTILASAFAAFAILASFGIGNMGQVNKIVANVIDAFPISSLQSHTLYEGGVSVYAFIIGIILMLLTATIVLGGLKRIASVAEKVVPFMVILFVVGSLSIIAVNYHQILPAFKAIFCNAFKLNSVAGGGLGYLISTVITQGFKRGIFSNEAGLGSAVMVNSNSNVKEPVQQGMWGIFEVFTDTIVVCTMTALVVLTSGVYDLTTGTIPEGVTDATLVANSFNSVFSYCNIGSKFIAVAMFLFAFTTILGWSHYGSTACHYLFGDKGVKIYKIIFVLFVIAGSLMTSSLAWDISDTFNALMMIPNLIGIISLSGLIMKITKNYKDRKLKNHSVQPMLSFFPDIQKTFENQQKNNAIEK